MIYRITLTLCLFSTVRLSGQWISFDLSKADIPTFQEQVEPLILLASINAGQVSMANYQSGSRLLFVFTIPVGWNFSGMSFQSNPQIFPMIAESQLLVTNNLIIKGKMNVFSPRNETIHFNVYGLNYFTNNGKDKNNWLTSLNIGRLEGPGHIRIRTFDSSFLWKGIAFSHNVHLGVGYNSYTSKILGFSNINIPSAIDNSITYLIAGAELNIAGFRTGIQMQMHSKFMQFNLQFFYSLF